jgi:hypothetical protein
MLFPRDQDEEAPIQNDETEQTIENKHQIVERPRAVKTKPRMSA